MKLLNANYELKAPISTPYIFEGKKWMNNQPHSFTSIPYYQINHHVPLITFHPSMNRFYIIWSPQFCQVYMLDLPFLQT